MGRALFQPFPAPVGNLRRGGSSLPGGLVAGLGDGPAAAFLQVAA